MANDLPARALAVALIGALAFGLACVAEATWIDAKAYLAQLLIARAWDRAESGEPAKPWPWADTRPIAKLTVFSARKELPVRAGRKQLTVGVGRKELTVGFGQKELMVLEGANGRNLAFGPTHDPASVLPGERGNSVIEGHRDTHFSVLRDLRIGDTMRVDLANGRSSRFAVVDLRVVDSTRWRIALNADTPRLTLVTCYPFDAVRAGGPLRFVVTGEQIEQ